MSSVVNKLYTCLPVFEHYAFKLKCTELVIFTRLSTDEQVSLWYTTSKLDVILLSGQTIKRGT